MLAIWSLVPLPFLKPAWTSGSPWFTYCWSLAWRILSITLLVCKTMVFPLVMYGYDSWAVKKAERPRIDAFELWCWRKLLRVPWTARRSNQSILKEIIPGVSLEGMMLKLKLQFLITCCEEMTHVKRPWCCEGLKAGGEGDDRGWDSWMASLTQWTWVWVNSGSWWWTGWPGVLWSMGSQRVGHNWVTELNWNWIYKIRIVPLIAGPWLLGTVILSARLFFASNKKCVYEK